MTRALLFDTLDATPPHNGGVGAVAAELLPAYIAVAAAHEIKFGFVDNWEGRRRWGANFGPYRFFYDLPSGYDDVTLHMVSAFRCGFRNARRDIDRYRPRKVIATHHDFVDLDYPWLFGQQERRARKDAYRSFARYDGLVVPSRGVADRLLVEFGIPSSKIAVIAHGNDQHVAADAPDHGRHPDRFILFVGKLWPHKNWERLLAACAAVSDDFVRAETKLLFLSADYAAKRDVLEQTRWALALSDIVEFRGYAAPEDIALLFRTASGLICPSLVEGFGMPIFEALAFGLPVCVSDIPVFREVLAIAGQPATLFDPLSIGGMAAAIRAFLKRIRGARARPFVRGWRQVAAEYLDFFETVGAANGR